MKMRKAHQMEHLDMVNLKTKIREFIIKTFLFGDGGALQDNTSFLGEEILDLIGVMELIHYLEEEYGIKLEDDELIPENLDSINNVAAFLSLKNTLRLAQ